ncbi:MAG: tRNA pseudouridine(38-40) synthase TruA [Myxococcales bacterium]|nr:tRNA pseudouridine(38-40) synthase TruA [Myxococcales bacterium]
MTVLVRLAYDGTDFHGYARQADPGVRTVQGCLEQALAGLYQRPVASRAASRTDAGVHALGQIAGFEPPLAIPPRGVVLGLLGKLPPDISVLSAWQATAPDGGPVEPRFWNLGKRYRYRIRTTARRVPQTHRFEWHLPRRLDLAAMQAAALHFAGEHDFAGFRAAGCQARTTVRRVHAVEVHGGPADEHLPPDPAVLPPAEGPELLTITVRGEAFLQNMVRIMVGTLVEVGAGRRRPDAVRDLLARPDRRRSGATAPPQGLTLDEVLWPDPWPPPPRAARPEPEDEQGEPEPAT